MEPMAAHEKVLVDGAFREDKIHGALPCTTCHGGNPEAPDFEKAHKGICRDPTARDAKRVCGACHKEITAHAATSLHMTLRPYQLAMEQRATESPDVQVHLATAREASCQSCHATCGQCHVSRPDSVAGGLLAGHVFKKQPPTRQVCTACHGSRVEKEYFGENEGGHPDVHRMKRMECLNCHTGAEMHGTGKRFDHRYSVDNGPKCAQCHGAIYEATAPNSTTHRDHKDKASCYVCHAQDYKNCASCHVGKDAAGQPFFKTAKTWMEFKIGKNPARTPLHPEKYVVLRHVPVSHDTFAYYAPNALGRFDSLPTWKPATPHNVVRKTPQNSTCNNCHGNSKLFLLQDDVDKSERRANSGVIVQPSEVPAVRNDSRTGDAKGAEGPRTLNARSGGG